MEAIDELEPALSSYIDEIAGEGFESDIPVSEQQLIDVEFTRFFNKVVGRMETGVEDIIHHIQTADRLSKDECDEDIEPVDLPRMLLEDIRAFRDESLAEISNFLDVKFTKFRRSLQATRKKMLDKLYNTRTAVTEFKRTYALAAQKCEEDRLKHLRENTEAAYKIKINELTASRDEYRSSYESVSSRATAMEMERIDTQDKISRLEKELGRARVDLLKGAAQVERLEGTIQSQQKEIDDLTTHKMLRQQMVARKQSIKQGGGKSPASKLSVRRSSSISSDDTCSKCKVYEEMLNGAKKQIDELVKEKKQIESQSMLTQSSLDSHDSTYLLDNSLVSTQSAKPAEVSTVLDKSPDPDMSPRGAQIPSTSLSVDTNASAAQSTDELPTVHEENALSEDNSTEEVGNSALPPILSPGNSAPVTPAGGTSNGTAGTAKSAELVQNKVAEDSFPVPKALKPPPGNVVLPPPDPDLVMAAQVITPTYVRRGSSRFLSEQRSRTIDTTQFDDSPRDISQPATPENVVFVKSPEIQLVRRSPSDAEVLSEASKDPPVSVPTKEDNPISVEETDERVAEEYQTATQALEKQRLSLRQQVVDADDVGIEHTATNDMIDSEAVSSWLKAPVPQVLSQGTTQMEDSIFTGTSQNDMSESVLRMLQESISAQRALEAENSKLRVENERLDKRVEEMITFVRTQDHIYSLKLKERDLLLKELTEQVHELRTQVVRDKKLLHDIERGTTSLPSLQVKKRRFKRTNSQDIPRKEAHLYKLDIRMDDTTPTLLPRPMTASASRKLMTMAERPSTSPGLSYTRDQSTPVNISHSLKTFCGSASPNKAALFTSSGRGTYENCELVVDGDMTYDLQSKAPYMTAESESRQKNV